MPHLIETATLRVLHPNGKTVGTGFLVAPNLAVTCAHVVGDADAIEGDTIQVQFTGQVDQIEAEVLTEFWSGVDKDDVAFLRLNKTPEGIKPLHMGLAEKCHAGKPFYSFGYTTAADEQGLGTFGRIITLAPGSKFLQLSSAEAYHGISGAPVYDEERKVVVGMINKGHVERQFAVEIDKLSGELIKGRFIGDLRTGITYAIPAEILHRLCPIVEIYQPKTLVRSPLVVGIHLLPYDYSVRIENFLTEYLGREDQPVPFGGREGAKQTLNNWLENSSTPYLLLAAPAGRGKSALLVRWLDELSERTDLALAFVPISIRFGTNMERVFYASLAARLAHLHGDDVPASPETSTEVYRGLVSRYLNAALDDGRTLLVVLDGLDEAADWQANEHFMPATLPAGVRVMVSARFLAGDNDSTAWLRRLNWNHNGLALAPTLDPLDQDGVADVLLQMGCPLDELSRKVDIVTKLHYLSQGDPLLVNLYVGDLWTKRAEAPRLKPDDLEHITPGYKGYFNDYWWKYQAQIWGDDFLIMRPHIQLVLNLLAGALGALKRDELIMLAPEQLNKYSLDNAFKSLQRFLIGDGVDQGYTFSHPKLGEYFWDELTKPEQELVEKRFLTWCAQMLDELISGKRDATRRDQLPAYVITNYTAHLLRARQPIEKFLPLIQHQQWAQAWFTLEGAYGGYSQDIQHTWEQCRLLDHEAIEKADKVPYLGKQIRCAMIESSLHSLAANIPSELIPVLVEQGIWTLAQVWVFIRQMPDSHQQAGTLVSIIPYLDDRQLGEALDAVQMIRDEQVRAHVMIDLIQRLPERELRGILKGAQTLRTDWNHAIVLSTIAQRLPEGELGEVLDAARALDDVGARTSVLIALARRLPEVTGEALDAAREIQPEWDRTSALIAVAQLLPEAEPEILEAAREIQDEVYRASVLSVLSQRMPEVVVEALETARAMQYERTRAHILIDLSQSLPEEELGQILEAARAIKNQEDRASVLNTLVWRMPAVAVEALETARAIEDERARANILSALVHHLPNEELQGVLEAAQAIQDEWARAMVMSDLVQQLPEGKLGQALDATQAIQDEGLRALVLSNLAQRLPEVEPGQILDAARAIQDLRARVNILSALAQRLPEGELGQVLEAVRVIQGEWGLNILHTLAQRLPERELGQILEMARMIQDMGAQAKLMSALARRLPELAGETLNTVQAIQDTGARASLLSALAQFLPEAATEAREAARAIQDSGNRIRVLITLSQYLPEAATEAIETTREMQDKGARTSALFDLVQRLPDEKLGEVLAVVRGMQEEAQVFGLSTLVQRLPEAAGEALQVVRAIQNEMIRAFELIDLAPYVPEGELGGMLETARAIQAEGIRALVLSSLAQRLPEAGAQALEAVQAIQDEGARANVLSALAQHLPEGKLGQVLEEGQALQDEGNRARVLSDLAPRLPEAAVEALGAAWKIQDEAARASVLSALAQFLPAGELREVHEAARAMQNEWARASVLSALIKRLPEATAEALDAVGAIPDTAARASVLSTLTRCLPDSELRGVLEAARAIRSEMDRARVLIDLAQYVPAGELGGVLEAAQALQADWDRASVLNTLAQRLLELPAQNYYEKLSQTFPVLARRTRSNLFSDTSALLPVLIHLGGEGTGREIFQAVQDVSRWWK